MDKLYRWERTRVFGRQGDPIVVRQDRRQEDCHAHEHDFIEIVLAVEGSGLQESARHSLAIKSGTLTVLRPGHWHAYLKCRKLLIYNCCFGPELLRRELSWLIDDAKLARLLWGSGETGPDIFHLAPQAVKRLRSILDQFLHHPKASYGMKVSRLGLFLTALSQELPPAPSGAREKMQPAVLKSIRSVEGDLARAWTVRGLAKECGCSPEYLIRLFKAAIGMTPYAYINRCRAERAAGLLLRSDASVAEIGEQIGWDEPCHFARRFKRQYGTSATEYRSRMKT